MKQRRTVQFVGGFWVAILLFAAAVYARPILEPNSIVYLPVVGRDASPKHCLAWSYISLSPNALAELNTNCYYHWASRPAAAAPGYATFYPMLWNDDRQLKTKLLVNVPRDYCGVILFANEPEFPDQADMTTARLIVMVDWLREMYPCAKLVGPQTHVCWYEFDQIPPCTPRGDYTVEGFIREYKMGHRGENPPIYAYGLHYGDVTVWPDRIGEMLKRYGITPRFFYTEWNYCGNNAGRLRNMLTFLNEEPTVEMYAYWSNLGSGNCMLFDFEAGVINWRGRVYATYGE